MTAMPGLFLRTLFLSREIPFRFSKILVVFRFDVMNVGNLPVSVVGRILFAVEIQLIHPESHQLVFGLNAFLISIAVRHSNPAHDAAAARVENIVRGADQGKRLITVFYV